MGRPLPSFGRGWPLTASETNRQLLHRPLHQCDHRAGVHTDSLHHFGTMNTTRSSPLVAAQSYGGAIPRLSSNQSGAQRSEPQVCVTDGSP